MCETTPHEEADTRTAQRERMDNMKYMVYLFNGDDISVIVPFEDIRDALELVDYVNSSSDQTRYACYRSEYRKEKR